MALRVIWNKRAEKSFSIIVEYLESKFGDKTTKSFVQRTFAIIENLSEYPKLGTLEIEEQGIRAFVITKHNTIFCRFTERDLILLNIFDNR